MKKLNIWGGNMGFSHKSRYPNSWMMLDGLDALFHGKSTRKMDESTGGTSILGHLLCEQNLLYEKPSQAGDMIWYANYLQHGAIQTYHEAIFMKHFICSFKIIQAQLCMLYAICCIEEAARKRHISSSLGFEPQSARPKDLISALLPCFFWMATTAWPSSAG